MLLWVVGPLVSLIFLLGCLFWLSWRNQNSPLVKKGDRWRPNQNSSSDFDPNAADAIPLNDYYPGVVVRLPNSLAPIIPIPKRATIVRFPLERIEDRELPPPPPKPPTFPRSRPRLRVIPSAK